MTTMLDILGDYCGIRNYKYSRIDGSMEVVDRQENVSTLAGIYLLKVNNKNTRTRCETRNVNASGVVLLSL